MSGTNVSKALIKIAKSINKKIQGTESTTQTHHQQQTKRRTNRRQQHRKRPTRKNTPHPRNHTYQSSFSDLVDLLENAENYGQTNEFKIPSLKDYSENLKNANQRIDTAVAQVKEKRIDRNQFLYTPETGLVDTALEAKDYIKGLFETSSPEFKAADAISFRNFKQ